MRERFGVQGVDIRVIGFAQIIGESAGRCHRHRAVLRYHESRLISLMLCLYCRCCAQYRSNRGALACSPVACQLRLLRLFSVSQSSTHARSSVPFLIFAIGIATRCRTLT
ncbi:hypothetical protein ACU8WE_30435 [Pseudomonas parakoreensis]